VLTGAGGAQGGHSVLGRPRAGHGALTALEQLGIEDGVAVGRIGTPMPAGLDRWPGWSRVEVGPCWGRITPCGLWWSPASRLLSTLRFLRGSEATPKYMLCNADEGDPGSFVNRNLMESDPHLVIEGMAIGGWATGAAFGSIYIRDEYPLPVGRMAD